MKVIFIKKIISVRGFISDVKCMQYNPYRMRKILPAVGLEFGSAITKPALLALCIVAILQYKL